MIKFIILIIVLVFAYPLENLERENLFIFWCVSSVLALSFTFGSFDRVPFQENSTFIDKNISSVLAIKPGGKDSRDQPSFVPTRPSSSTPGRKAESPPRNTNKSGSNANTKPQYHDAPDPKRSPNLWGVSQSNNPNGGDNPSDLLSSNEVPKEDNWINDPSLWDKSQENDLAGDNEETQKPGKLQADIDFPYQYDENGNPTLLIPNAGRTKKKRLYNKIEFDQTSTHMHHAPDFGIDLPPNFDLDVYKSLDRKGRIQYTKNNVPRETVIQYQNELGKGMSPLFGTRKTKSVPGFAGKRKRNTELTIQMGTKNEHILSVIGEDGIHRSSYQIDDNKLQNIMDNDFWIWPYRDI